MNDLDMTETTRIANVPMREMVYGRTAPRRFRLPTRLIFLVAFVSMSVGCATALPVVEVESVGVLTASATHVTSQPVHATTDFGHAQIVETSDDESGVADTVTRVADDAELPEVAPKTDGVVMGEVR